MTKNINDKTFQKEVVEQSKTKPVLVDFFAEWCMPCQMQSPILEEISSEMKDQVAIRKINIEESNKTAGDYKVMSIPTLILFKEGQPKETLVGLQEKQQLTKLLEKYA
ncbi:MAG: thioredoxin [Candidatus Moranbacteria bacterium]|nr:thioredoxin [Candidatus Moranbacteria bacterium]